MNLCDLIDENIEILNLKEIAISHDVAYDQFAKNLFKYSKSKLNCFVTEDMSFDYFKQYIYDLSDETLVVFLFPIFSMSNIDREEIYRFLIDLQKKGRYLINITAGINGVFDERFQINYENLLIKTINHSSVDKIARNASEKLFFFKSKCLFRLTDEIGTNLTFEIEKVLNENFPLTPDNRVMQLPHGEVFVVPKLGTMNGKIVFIYKFDTYNFDVVNDYVELDMPNISGKYPICEIGFGTNAAIPPINALPYLEKRLNTYHLGFGGNSNFGGKYELN